MHKVSVITINKNNGSGLEKTIQSIINQTFTDYEFIVIDGKSTDGSYLIIKQYENHINYWVSETDSGIYQAMNKGIAKATGKYIIFINSGDCFISPNTLSNIFGIERTAYFLVGKAIIDGKRLRIRTYLPKNVSFYSLAKHPVCHQATFTKRVLFDELGKYDETLAISSDWKFLLIAIFLNNKTLELLNEDIALLEPNGISAKDESTEIMIKEREYIFKTYFPHLHEEYIKEDKIKKYSFTNIKMHLIWRFKRLLIG